MRSFRTLVLAAGLVFLVGVVLVVTSRFGGDSEYGWFAYAPGEFSVSDSVVVMTTREVVGWSIVWLTTIVAAAVIGYRRAMRHSPSN